MNAYHVAKVRNIDTLVKCVFHIFVYKMFIPKIRSKECGLYYLQQTNMNLYINFYIAEKSMVTNIQIKVTFSKNTCKMIYFMGEAQGFKVERGQKSCEDGPPEPTPRLPPKIICILKKWNSKTVGSGQCRTPYSSHIFAYIPPAFTTMYLESGANVFNKSPPSPSNRLSKARCLTNIAAASGCNAVVNMFESIPAC